MADNEGTRHVGGDDGYDGIENGQDAEIVDSLVVSDHAAGGGGNNVDDPELEAIKARVREMEEEAEKLKQLQSEVDKQMNLGSPPTLSEIRTLSLFTF